MKPEFTVLALSAPLDDWTGARIIIRSEDCPGGVAAIIGGAEEHAPLIVNAPKLFNALKAIVPKACPIVTHHRSDCEWCAALVAIAAVERG